jgi:formiminotetrahydrofolate cyclodeaminase
MHVDRTGVAVSAMAARLAMELLAKVIEVSKPAQLDAWLAQAWSEADKLRRAAEEDVAAYNVYLECRRNSAGTEELRRALRGTIEVPMAAARAAVAGIELCVEVSETVRAAVAADLGTAAALLDGAVRGMMLCIDANLRAAGDDPEFAMLRSDARDLAERAHRMTGVVVSAVSL